MILELSLRRNRGEPVDTVMKSTSLHLKTPDNHLEVPTDMHKRHKHMLISYWKNHDYDKHFSDIANMHIMIVFNLK